MEKEFETFNEAFDFCREKNSPVVVRIQNERWKLYPSGKAEKKKNPPIQGRLGNFVLVDKKRLSKELSDFQSGVKSKEDVEAVADVFFEQMRRLNGVK